MLVLFENVQLNFVCHIYSGPAVFGLVIRHHNCLMTYFNSLYIRYTLKGLINGLKKYFCGLQY